MGRSRFAPSRTLVLHFAVLLIGALAAAGSATTRVEHVPKPVPAAHDVELQRAASFRLGIRYGQELPAGSRWRAAAVLPEGTVLRPLNAVFMVDSRVATEGWPVVAEGKLQGFFLPSDRSFAPVRPALPIALAPVARS